MPTRTLCLVLLLAGATSAWAAPAAVTRLAPDDIQKGFFNGQTFTSATPSNIKFKMTFTADGKVVREPVGKSGVKGEGTWKLDKDGFCTTWKHAKPNCFVVLANGDNKWSVMKGPAVIAVWSK